MLGGLQSTAAFRAAAALAATLVLLALATPLSAWAGTSGCALSETWWTAQETWAWTNVCRGERAVLSDRFPPAQRTISPRFLRSILLLEPYRTALGDASVEISAARFDKLYFGGATLSRSLALDNSEFTDTADFSGADVRNFACNHCVFRRDLLFPNSKATNITLVDASLSRIDVSAAQISGVLDLSTSAKRFAPSITAATTDTPFLGDVDASGVRVTFVDVRYRPVHALDFGAAHVSGNLLLSNVSATGAVVVREGHIDEKLDLARSNLPIVDLGSAIVGRSVILQDTTSARIRADAISVGQDFVVAGSLDANAPCSRTNHIDWIDLGGARIGGTIDASRIRIGRLDAPSAFVRLNVVFEESCISAAIMEHLHAGGNLYVLGSSLSTLSLAAAKIDGLLFLDSRHRRMWRPPGAFVLRDASAHVVEDRADDDCEEDACIPWPKGCVATHPMDQCVDLDVTGFTYSTLGIRSGETSTVQGHIVSRPLKDMVDRKVSRWQNLLNRTPYAQQPYEQLASVLRDSGRSENATAVLYESRNRETANPDTGPFRYAYLVATKILIGYGYHPALAALWALAIIVIGVLILEGTGQYSALPSRNEPRFVTELIYSFDALIPLVTLRKTDDDVLDGFARYWFYFQKAFGYVLATFLVAGLSGLTK